MTLIDSVPLPGALHYRILRPQLTYYAAKISRRPFPAGLYTPHGQSVAIRHDCLMREPLIAC